ncbi:MAG TPA: hypothetical protein VFW98_08425 [Gemmatimonadaceae bacterium]|nr:hypothetical protein [Gemmatimonadaceae bacterium]
MSDAALARAMLTEMALTRRQLAYIVGCSRRQLARIVAGRAPLPTDVRETCRLLVQGFRRARRQHTPAPPVRLPSARRPVDIMGSLAAPVARRPAAPSQ